MNKPENTRSRRRTIRISILAGSALLCAGGLYGLYSLQSGETELTPTQVLDQAEAAHQDSDYAKLIELLEDTNLPGNTIAEIRSDAKRLRWYIDARQNTPLPNGEHLLRTIAPLKQITRLDPGDQDARENLLDLLMLTGRDGEVVELCEQWVDEDGEQAMSWRYLGAAQARLGAKEKALEAYMVASALEPLHVPTQSAIVGLALATNQPLDGYTQRARQIHEDHPDDPRAELIRAFAALVQDDKPQATQWILAAAKRQPPEPGFVPVLVSWMDRAGLYSQAAEYLAQLPADQTDGFTRRETIYRAYENDNHALIIDRLKDVKPSDMHPDLVAVLAIANHKLGNKKQAQQQIEQLKVIGNPLATLWAQTLTASFDPDAKPAALIDTLAPVLLGLADTTDNAAIRKHPYLNQLLAEAYLRVQETDAALRSMRRAAEQRPSWSRPHRLLAQTLLDLGRPNEAIGNAVQAWQCKPDPANDALRTTALLAVTDASEPNAVTNAVSTADQLLASSPLDAEVLPGLVDLLARGGRGEQARQRISAVLDSQSDKAQALLPALLRIDLRHGLGLGPTILSSASNANEPELLLSRAMSLAAAGKRDQGQALLEQAVDQSDTPAMRLSLARYLALNASDKAAAYWADLADTLPDDFKVQQQALAVPGILQDKAFAQRAIDRMKSISGDNATHWRLEQARLVMQPPGDMPALQRARAVLVKAEQLLPDRLETQVMLAQCLLQMNEPAQAERHAERAVRLSPDHQTSGLLLGQALHEQQKFTASTNALVPIALDEQAPPTLRVSASAMLIDQNEAERVVRAMQSVLKQNSTKTAAPVNEQTRQLAVLLLASAYDKLGQHADVAATLEQEIPEFNAGPDDHPQHYVLLANALMQQGKASKAWSLLAPLIENSRQARRITVGLIAQRVNNADTAVRWIGALDALDGNTASQRYEYAGAAFMAGMRLKDPALVKEADRLITQVLASSDTHPASSHYLQGQARRALGDAQGAEAGFRDALRLDPGNAQVMNDLAMLLIDRGKHKLAEAEQLAEQASRSSKDPNYLDTLALVRMRMGKLSEAQASINQAIRLDPDNPAWRLTHADILEALGQADRAQTIRERYRGAAHD